MGWKEYAGETCRTTKLLASLNPGSPKSIITCHMIIMVKINATFQLHLVAPYGHGDVTSLQNEIHMLASSSL
jgi:hypothetical protein